MGDEGLAAAVAKVCCGADAGLLVLPRIGSGGRSHGPHIASFCVLITSNARVRYLANFVLLVTLWGYVAPVALGPSEADLPACCRGKGKHHCAMARMARSDDGAPGVRTTSPQCPYRLLGSVLNRDTVAAAKESFALEPPASSLFSRRDSARAVSVLNIRNSGRGPPASSL